MNDRIEIEPASYLMVCLCDVTAEDAKANLATLLGGVPVQICEQHKGVAKLQSLTAAGLNTAMVFAHYEANGDFYPKTLAEICQLATTSSPVTVPPVPRG